MRWLSLLAVLVGLGLAVAPVFGATQDVVVVPVHGTIDEGMAHLVSRAVADARG